MDPIYLILALFFLEYSLPLHLKFGNEKGRILSFTILGLLAFAIFTIARTSQGFLLLSALKHQSPLIIIVILLFLCILFLGISYVRQDPGKKGILTCKVYPFFYFSARD